MMMSGLVFKGSKMSAPKATSNKSRKNLILILCIVFACMLLLCFRLGWIQIVKGSEYSDKAVQQQTRDTPIEAERGVIYDTNKKELAVSVTCYTIWARPSDVQSGETKAEKRESAEKVAKTLSKILKMDYGEVNEMVTREQSIIKIKKGIDKATADKIREKSLPGIEIAEDTKRSYPMGAFAAHTLGTVTDDNSGLSGLELEYNTYLSGVAGRWINYTDTGGNRLSYGEEKYYQAEDGYGLVTTIDQVIQHYTEKAIAQVHEKTSASRVMALVMNPKNGDVLAMAQIPEFDLNNPKVPLDKKEQKALEEMSDTEKVEYWNKMWRNSLVSDVYEPGSTFKLLTTAIALEEGEVDFDDTFTCNGYITVSGQNIHCWSDTPHGTQNLKQAVGNSCNPVLVQIATKIGIEKFYTYMETFGITGTTGIDFPGESTAILQSKETAGPVGLATIGFGQGVAVTPIQLVTAVSSFGNEGKLMKPRLVKELVDDDGNTVKEIEPEVVRQVVSKETADDLCDVMEFVVDEGGGGAAAVEGYRVGGKTGTANKVKADGTGYSNDTYSSCIAMAPMDDPQITVLVIVDSPKGVHFGSVTAAPGVQQILSDTLRYLNISPTEADKDEEGAEDEVEVPNLIGQSVSMAMGILAGESLEYDTDEEAAKENDFIVTKQYPAAGTKVKKGSKVYLYKE